ncbi:MAG: hypothetical protein JW910_01410, partial [Anaerolineae bacterium]|nr:hypothetical protein [Anaerolineae bacterium]
GRWAVRFSQDAPHTLDGMAYMPYAERFENGVTFSLNEDYQMIRWLQQYIEGTPVVLEGQSNLPYTWSARVSIYTGLPTIIGWDHHQRQQRTLDPLSRLVDQRVQNVNAIYDGTDVQAAWDLLQYYDVSYLVVGQLERAYYSSQGLAKFDDMVDLGQLDLVFEYGETRVYRVVQDGEVAFRAAPAGISLGRVPDMG